MDKYYIQWKCSEHPGGDQSRIDWSPLQLHLQMKLFGCTYRLHDILDVNIASYKKIEEKLPEKKWKRIFFWLKRVLKK